MKINYLSVVKGVPATGYWDHSFLNDLLGDLPDGDRNVVIVPGAYQADAFSEINNYISQFDKVMVFITSDEERKFDCSKLEHPDMILYCQYGGCGHSFPIGYTSETRKRLKEIGFVKKDIELFFAGQLNSSKRQGMFSRLAYYPRSVLFGTEGFSRGLPPEQYYDYLAHAIFAPAPGGHVSPDSFRFYEALEAGCVPVEYPEYMNELFGDLSMLNTSNDFFAWWIKEKMNLKNKLREELGCPIDSTTVIITTSPIPSHPSTEIIDETIKSVRHHLNSDIIIGIDGIRPEQQDRKAAYDEYIKKLLWKCNFEYDRVIPVVFDTHKHQSGMMKEILPMVKTPLLLFVEHDTPLVTDEPIDFPYLQKTLLDAKAFTIRLHYEAVIPEPHKHLMIGEPKNQLLATAQWSNRPHIARTNFYKELMKFFSENSNCFIEDLLYGRLITAWENDQWDNWRVYIYYPEGGNIKRSLNLDGRGSDVKFEKEQVF